MYLIIILNVYIINFIMNINPKIFEVISTKSISFLYELDHRLKINKNGKFKYFKLFNFEIEDIKNYLNKLDDDKIFTLIPLISKNDKTDEPCIILSQQILITSNSNPVLLANFIDSKISKTFELFNSNIDISFYTIFKYKSIEIDYKSINNFN
uniref:Uncharacterized protein n=1 Tax=Russula foetens TaxID=131541 RepID=A0A2S0U3W9_9AGAM|nr:hypothetical protein [Russula foetens]AWB36164.1 hypothetical protein [Russula foetens]